MAECRQASTTLRTASGSSQIKHWRCEAARSAASGLLMLRNVLLQGQAPGCRISLTGAKSCKLQALFLDRENVLLRENRQTECA